MQYTIKDLSEIESIAKTFINDHATEKLFAFEADMGAGKTTFINALCKVLKVKDETSSPTYSLVNEYHSDYGIIYHMDLYRINDLEEAYDAGIEEYLYSGAYCFIEWPSKIDEIIPSRVVKVFINLGLDNERLITTDYEKGN